MARKKNQEKTLKDVTVDTPVVDEAPKKATRAKAAKSAPKGEMVCVMLNRPQGIKFLINGGKTVVEINGNGVDLKGKPKGILPVGGYGMTMVPREQWEQVKKLYGRMAYFANNLIVEADDKASAVDMTDDLSETRNGFEPVDVTHDKTQDFEGIAE